MYAIAFQPTGDDHMTYYAGVDEEPWEFHTDYYVRLSPTSANCVKFHRYESAERRIEELWRKAPGDLTDSAFIVSLKLPF
jgi:hypothetical protein